MQDLNNLAIAIIGGTIATVLGGLLLKTISNMKFPKIDLFFFAKLSFLIITWIVFWFIGLLIAEARYTYCFTYVCSSNALGEAVIATQIVTTITTMVLVVLASRLFRTPNK